MIATERRLPRVQQWAIFENGRDKFGSQPTFVTC